ncbi:MAG: hypothetical protein FJ004_03390 [Chloroflexi bacterium]|nr:hypothetical protein [Chloroflexota bacterium]
MEVVVGTLIYRQGAYILDKFLANQKEIQRECPSSELVLATNEIDFVADLERAISDYGLKGRVITYDTVKPDYARSAIWNVACGREALRQYVLTQTDAQYLLSVDADIVCEPSIVKILKKKIHGYDVVFSGSPIRGYGVGLCGAGCMMVSRDTLKKVKFRCIEFKNGDVMFEDNMLEMDLFKLGAKVRKGLFLHCSHYKNKTEARHVAPQPTGVYRALTTASFFRYLLIRSSIVVNRNIPWRLKTLVDELRGETW